MGKFQFSIDKFFDHIGKVGVMLITGGIAGSLFTNKVSLLVGFYSVAIGIVFAIIGSIETKQLQEKE